MSADLMPSVSLSNLAFEFIRLCEHEMDWKRFPKNRGFVNAPGQERLEQVFQVLLAENLRSLRARYRCSMEYQKRHYGDRQAIAPAAGYQEWPIDVAGIIRLCNCYDYQASQTRDYPHTLAAKIVRMTREGAFNAWLRRFPVVEHWASPVRGFVGAAPDVKSAREGGNHE